jgi:hypothetical protein
LVRGVFFVESLLQRRNGVGEAQPFGPSGQHAVPGDLVVLERLANTALHDVRAHLQHTADTRSSTPPEHDQVRGVDVGRHPGFDRLGSRRLSGPPLAERIFGHPLSLAIP